MLSLIVAGALSTTLATTMATSLDMSADLAGGTWRPSTIHAHEVPADERIFIAFETDGKAFGSGGCNRFFGGYTIDGNAIKIGPIASTKMGCPGKYELETSFFSMLQKVKTFSQEGTSLVFFDAAGEKVAELVRVEDT